MLRKDSRGNVMNRGLIVAPADAKAKVRQFLLQLHKKKIIKIPTYPR
jgi:hypothetical protein